MRRHPAARGHTGSCGTAPASVLHRRGCALAIPAELRPDAPREERTLIDVAPGQLAWVLLARESTGPRAAAQQPLDGGRTERKVGHQDNRRGVARLINTR
jgi:hypothetical protein